MAWAGSDSTKVYVGFGPQPTRHGVPPSIGMVIDPLKRHPPVPAEEADAPTKYVVARWVRSPSSRVTYKLVGLSIPAPRLVGWSLVPLPASVEWEPHGWGYETIVFEGDASSISLLSRYVWNSRAPSPTAGGLVDPRGEFVGFIKQSRGGWEILIWPYPVEGGSHAGMQ